jgi:NAD(P)-dependent dehydrogenase (short-subunit alcohol dehydrogenase family)
VQLINNLPTDAMDRIKNNPNLQVLSTPSDRVIFVGMDAGRPPFNDVRVRQAMNYAIDKQTIVKDLLSGYADVATGPMHSMVPGFNDKLKQYDYDPAKAKDLLAQAGYANGLKVKFGYPSGRYLMDKLVGQAIVGQLAKAGITADAVSWKMTPAQWDDVIAVNLSGCFHWSRAAGAVLRGRGWGRIVNISSINGMRGKAGQANYAASKGGMIALSKSLAKELGRSGVTVNVVAPGMVRTPMTASLPDRFVEAAIEESAVGRIAEPEDCADAVVRILTDNLP